MSITKKPEWWTVLFVVLLSFSVGFHLMQYEQHRQATDAALKNIEGSIAMTADIMQNADSVENADETVHDAHQMLGEAIGQVRTLAEYNPELYSVDHKLFKAMQELDGFFIVYIDGKRTQTNLEALKDLSLVYSIHLKAKHMKDAETFNQVYQDLHSKIREEGYLNGTDFERVIW